MGDSQHQAPSTRSMVGSDTGAQHPNSGDLERDGKKPVRDREEEWQQRLRSLQEWVSELLIKNEQLRMSLLDSGTDGQKRGTNEEPVIEL